MVVNGFGMYLRRSDWKNIFSNVSAYMVLLWIHDSPGHSQVKSVVLTYREA